MSYLGIREANEEEIEWLNAQLDPPGFYLNKFLALKKKYGAIEVDSPGKATKLKRSLTVSIGREKMEIRIYVKGSTVLLVRDDWDSKEKGAKKQ